MKDRKARKRGGVSQFRGISKEQVCVFVGRDRKKNTISKVACVGRIEKNSSGKSNWQPNFRGYYSLYRWHGSNSWKPLNLKPQKAL